MWKGYNGNAVQASEYEVSSGDRYADNAELVALAQSGGGESREAMDALSLLVEHNMGLVKKIALRFRDRGVDMEDLIQIGTIGMIKAVRSFDTGRGTCFSTYAVPLIFGEIRRHMRDEGPIKVGRYYKRLGALAVSYKNRVLQDEGREVRISEIASALGASAEDVAMAIDAVSPVVSLSDAAYGEEDGIELEATLADMESLYEREWLLDRLALGDAIRTMSPIWQKIIILRYYRGMTQQEVATRLGLSQVKVSREEKKILAYIRERL
jgi:RNA polymerase sporulation-specific sigma factor